MSIRSLLNRLRNEDGIIVPTTVAVLAVALILVGVAAASTQFSSNSANKDRRAKRAQQAADAGIAAALDRMNRLDVTHGAGGASVLQCIGLDATGTLTLAPTSSGTWCPAVGEDLGNDDSYSYRVRPVTQASGALTTQWSVVSTGTSAGTTRRVIVDATAQTGAPLIGSYALISAGQADLNITNSARVIGNVEANANINLNQSATLCGGSVTPGPGATVTTSNTASTCSPPSTTDTPVTLSPVNQYDAPTNNDNARICRASPAGDPCSRTGVTYDPVTRRLSLNGGSLTLGGSVYSFCQIDTQGNSQLAVAPGARVKIYIDAPENCPNQPANSSVGGVNFGNQTTITNNTPDPNDPSHPDPTALQMYVVGSPTPGVCSSLPIPTPSTCAVIYGNNNVSYFMLYAPYSAVSIRNQIDIHGAVAAKQVSMENNSQIHYESAVGLVVGSPVYPVFKVQGYRECSPTPPAGSSSPDTGC